MGGAMNASAQRNKTIRLIVILGAVALTAGLLAHGIAGSDGLSTYRQNRREYETLTKRIAQQRKQNAQLHVEVQKLQTDPATIERYARTQLHMSRHNEIIYVTPPAASKGSAPHNTRPAR